MRIFTIFGISLILATGILVGWSLSYLDQTSVANPQIVPSSAIPPIHLAKSELEIHTDIQRIERLLTASRPLEALAVLEDSSPTDLSSATGKEWLKLLVDVYAATDNQEQLILIYSQFPDALKDNEKASLIIAKDLIKKNKIHQYDNLRNHWSKREKEKSVWLFLDVESKIMNSKANEAIKLLEASKFDEKEETDRLIRLAALYLSEDPKRSWNYLSDAVKINPENADFYGFKANLSESLHQDQLALRDYISAIDKDPENLYRREQLADYYLRERKFLPALEILEDTMSPPSLDSIWLKTTFWNMMAIPTTKLWNEKAIPDGSLKNLVSYILTLPGGIYWNEQSFLKLANHQTYSSTRQETFWLKLLFTLKNNQYEQALQLLNDNIFTHVSWAPNLEKSLKTLVSYQLIQNKVPENTIKSIISTNSEIKNAQQFIQFLVKLSELPIEQLQLAVPPQLNELMLSKEAFAMTFMAERWTEAGIQLHVLEKFPESFPSWIVETMVLAIQQNRNNKEALKFALSQKPTSSLSLLIAQIALKDGENQIAFNALKDIYKNNDASGQQAALILSQFLLDHDNFKDAKKALSAHPDLENENKAKEIYARLAVKEGDLKKAYLLYKELESYSSEAKSFLARKAFIDQQWSRARELTESLIKEYPENIQLKDNLKKIIAEQQRKN